MVRITNEVLAEKIDNININLKNIKTDVRSNTEFRLKATGIMAILGGMAGFLGAGIFWFLNKFWEK